MDRHPPRSSRGDTFDLAVVGGGPAGLFAALVAARKGMRPVVFERRASPVDKACGEGLMPTAVELLRAQGIVPGGFPFAGIRYVDGSARAEARFSSGHGLGVRRTELHRCLSVAAAEAGVVVRPQRIDDVSQSDGCVRVGGVTAGHLLAADGLHSTVRRRLGLDRTTRRPSRWGVRAHYAVQPWHDLVEVHWAPDSEAYVTPVADGLVGVAFLGTARLSWQDRLAAFPALRSRLPGHSVDRALGAGPLRQRSGDVVAGRCLLVGDAAGYVDALTGEGLAIAFAGAQAAVTRVVQGRPAAYRRDHARLTRRYRVLTEALVRSAGCRRLRPRIVPLAGRFPAAFHAAVDALA